MLLKQNETLERMSSQVDNLQTVIKTLKSNPISDEIVNEILVEELVEEEKLEDPTIVFEEFINQFKTEETKLSAVKSLRLWLINISNNPDNKNLNRVNTTNPSYKAHLVCNPKTNDLFRSAGFQLSENFWEFQKSHTERLKSLLEVVQECLKASFNQFSKAEPWKMVGVNGNGNKNEVKEEVKENLEEKETIEKDDNLEIAAPESTT